MEKFDALRCSFDRKSPNFSHPICPARDTQKHLFDLHMSQIFTVLTSEQYEGKNFRKFEVARVIFWPQNLFVQSCPILMGVTLNNFDCIYLTNTTCAMLNGDLQVNLLKRNSLLELWIFVPQIISSSIYNTSSSQTLKLSAGPLTLELFLEVLMSGLAGCPTQQSWVNISPAFDF